MTLHSMDCPVKKKSHFLLKKHVPSGTFTHFIFSDKFSSEQLTARVSSTVVELDKHLSSKLT